MSATEEQNAEHPDLREAGRSGASDPEKPLRRIFKVVAVVLGGTVGLVAILLNWYLGRLLS